MPRISRRALLVTGVAAGVATSLPAAARRAGAQSTGATTPAKAGAAAKTILNDASRLSPTPVARHWQPTQVTGDAWIGALRAELKQAAADRRPVSVGAARHSMGGQALVRDGVAMTLDVPGADTGAARGTAPGAAWIDVNRETRVYRVAAGARWRQVIAALDPVGLSPAVMQSNHDFGVAGTLSVNAHGWPVPYGPFGATVRSFRMMLASGDLITCSPTEHADLCSLATGGYGLFGVIVDLDVSAAENRLLRPTHELMPAAELGPRMVTAITQDTSVRMAYGRLAVDTKRFLREALLVTLRPVPGTPPAVTSGGMMVSLGREVFRAQIGSDRAKRARWYAETVAAPKTSSGIASRNTFLNEPVANLAGRDKARTDILHEYFLPAHGLESFLAACREIIPRSRQDLLNVTLRYVEGDKISVLTYAPGTRVAAVMLFSQPMTRADEEDMAAMTRRLIDAAHEGAGSFYLPYRLHARREQVARAYPRLEEFVMQKHVHDAGLLFRNTLWDTYLAK